MSTDFAFSISLITVCVNLPIPEEALEAAGLPSDMTISNFFFSLRLMSRSCAQRMFSPSGFPVIWELLNSKYFFIASESTFKSEKLL